MNRNIIDSVFTLLVFALPFNYIPRILWQDTIGGPFGKDLVIYPLFIGVIYTVYYQWKYGNVFLDYSRFKKFVLVYLGVVLLSIVWGLINYPFYNQIFNGPLDQMAKLPRILSFFRIFGISIDPRILLKFLMIVRPFKSVLLETLYTFCAVYMIYCWYHDRAQRAVDILLKVTTIDLVIIGAYGLVDVCYQNGQMWAQQFISTTFPLLHGDVAAIVENYGYQNNIFWNAQNRSIFTEPSYFGIYLAFAVPLLWWNIFRGKDLLRKAVLIMLYTVLSFEMFLTQSRTALAVNLTILLIFIALCIFKRKKDLIVLMFSLCFCCAIGFMGAIGFMKFGQVPSQIGDIIPLASEWENNKTKEEIVKGIGGSGFTSYVNENVHSLFGKEEGAHAGSNHSRYILLRTNIEIGMEHPLLGIGRSLRVGFLRDKLANDTGAEIQHWNKEVDKRGVFRGGYFYSSELAVRFCETGILGLGLFLLPALFILWRYIKILLQWRIVRNQNEDFIFALLSFLGILSTGLGDTLNNTFCYWMAMAVSLLILRPFTRNMLR